MVESGPFIEYACELYIHHDVMNVAIATVIVFAVVLVLCSFAFSFWLFLRRCGKDVV